MAQVRMNDSGIRARAIKAWEGAMLDFQKALIIEFTENKWAWPSGQSPRDIIDTGHLRNQTMAPGQAFVNGTVYDWAWNADYALLVHNGGTFRSGRTYPARPWTKVPLEKLPGFYKSRMTGGGP